MFRTVKLKKILPIFLVSSLAISFCNASTDCCFLEQRKKERQVAVNFFKSMFWGVAAMASFVAIADSVAHQHKEKQLILGAVGFLISLIGLSSASDSGQEYEYHYHDSTGSDVSDYYYDHGHDYYYDYHYDDDHHCHGNCCHDHHVYVHEPTDYVYYPEPVVSNTYVDQSTYVDATTQVVQPEEQQTTYIDPNSSWGQIGQSVYNVMNAPPSS